MHDALRSCIFLFLFVPSGSMGGSFKPVIPELCLRGVDFGPPPQRKVRGRGLASQSYLWMATDGDQDRSPSPETRSGPRQHPRSHTISPLDTPFKQPITPSAFRVRVFSFLSTHSYIQFAPPPSLCLSAAPCILIVGTVSPHFFIFLTHACVDLNSRSTLWVLFDFFRFNCSLL